jgi:diguanylate cyclase (GGDEF)-like protein
VLLTERTQTRGGLAARFGGEEFVWLLPGVTLEAAAAEAEALRIAIRNAALSHTATPSGVLTASVGVTAGDGPPSALLASADAALYRAKARGRDRVEMGSELHFSLSAPGVERNSTRGAESEK